MNIKYPLLILKIACFCLFVGRSWQHLIWDIPIRTLLWDQDIMEGIVTRFTKMSWQMYATSPLQDTVIQWSKIILGIFYGICAFLCFFITKNRKWIGNTFLAATTLLAFLAFLYYKEKFFHLGQLFEYTTQISTPILLFLLLYTNVPKKQLNFIAKIAIAFTFICHGLYAIGYYPQPGHFVDMVIRGLFLTESKARFFLKIVGFIDIIIGITMFIPFLWKASIGYAFVWGSLTAIARVTSNFYVDFPLESLNQWLPEMLFRVPHGLIPLFVLILGNALVTTKNEFINSEKIIYTLKK